MSKKHIVVLTDKQINLLLSCILSEYALGLDDDDVRNHRMVDNIQKALVNSMKV